MSNNYDSFNPVWCLSEADGTGFSPWLRCVNGETFFARVGMGIVEHKIIHRGDISDPHVLEMLKMLYPEMVILEPLIGDIINAINASDLKSLSDDHFIARINYLVEPNRKDVR